RCGDAAAGDAAAPAADPGRAGVEPLRTVLQRVTSPRLRGEVGAKRRVRGTFHELRSLRVPLTPTLAAEVGYIRLRPPVNDRTRVNPSSIASGEREQTELAASLSINLIKHCLNPFSRLC